MAFFHFLVFLVALLVFDESINRQLIDGDFVLRQDMEHIELEWLRTLLPHWEDLEPTKPLYFINYFNEISPFELTKRLGDIYL